MSIAQLRREEKLLASTKRNIPQSVFGRVVKEIVDDHGHYRITHDATKVLHEESEEYLTARFAEALIVAQNAQRQTVAVGDMRAAASVRALYPRGPNA